LSGPNLRELVDRHEITEVLADYVRAADRIDLELLRSVFHPEATADYGAMFRGTGYGFADFIGSVHPGMDSHHHQLGSISIRLNGDRAASETYVTVYLRFSRPDGTSGLTSSHGRYLDEWERRDERWRIAARRYLHHLDETRDSEGGQFPTTSARDRTDPVYDLIDRVGPGRVGATDEQ
jgi:hypothetical protein